MTELNQSQSVTENSAKTSGVNMSEQTPSCVDNTTTLVNDATQPITDFETREKVLVCVTHPEWCRANTMHKGCDHQYVYK
jgi:hypothetical protein